MSRRESASSFERGRPLASVHRARRGRRDPGGRRVVQVPSFGSSVFVVESGSKRTTPDRKGRFEEIGEIVHLTFIETKAARRASPARVREAWRESARRGGYFVLR
jgi:hypothetical protein